MLREIAGLRVVPEPALSDSLLLLSYKAAKRLYTEPFERQFLQARYHELIEAVYAGRTEVPMVTEVKYRDGRKGRLTTTIRVRSVYRAAGQAGPGLPAVRQASGSPC